MRVILSGFVALSAVLNSLLGNIVNTMKLCEDNTDPKVIQRDLTALRDAVFASDEAAKTFLIAYEDWIYSRQNSIRELRHLSSKISHDTKALVSKGISIGATSASIGATICGILGAIFLPLAPVLIPAAMWTGAVMGITATTSTVVGISLDDAGMQRAKGVLELTREKRNG